MTDPGKLLQDRFNIELLQARVSTLKAAGEALAEAAERVYVAVDRTTYERHGGRELEQALSRWQPKRRGAMADEYPIAVERLSPKQASTLVCPNCGFERQAQGREIERMEFIADCPCGATELEWKYAEGDTCPGCGRLGWWQSAYQDNACSRACHFQAEYAASLAEKRQPVPISEDTP